MTGTKGVLVTPRDLHLFRELATAKLLDREMIQSISFSTSVATANDRLIKLHRAGLLRRYFVGTQAGGRKALYTISPKSAALINQQTFWKFQRPENQTLVGDVFVGHQSAVNQVWIGAKYKTTSDIQFLRWLNFQKPVSPSIPLTPDGYAELEGNGTVFPIFFEIDLGSETSKVWQRKIALYLKLASSGEFQQIFSQPRFRVAIVTDSERRRANLRQLVAKTTTKIFFFADLNTITQHGLYDAHWLRPIGDERVSLL